VAVIVGVFEEPVLMFFGASYIVCKREYLHDNVITIVFIVYVGLCFFQMSEVLAVYAAAVFFADIFFLACSSCMDQLFQKSTTAILRQ